MEPMNFELFHKGFYSLMMSVGVAMTAALGQPQPLSTPLKQPEISETINLFSPPPVPLENYNIELPTESTQEAAAEQPVSPTPSDEPVEATVAALVTVDKPLKAVKKASLVVEGKVPPAFAKATSGKEVPKVPKVEKAEEKKETPKASASPSPVSIAQKLVGSAEKLFQMINDHRKDLGLKAFETDDRICKIATARAPQIHDEVFGEGPIHKGFKALNLDYWATENAAAYETIDQNLKFWLTDAIHKKAIEGDSKYSCVACSGTSCSQIFTSFTPKN